MTEATLINQPYLQLFALPIYLYIYRKNRYVPNSGGHVHASAISRMESMNYATDARFNSIRQFLISPPIHICKIEFVAYSSAIRNAIVFSQLSMQSRKIVLQRDAI